MLPDYDTTNNIEKKFNEEIQGQIAEKATPWGLMGTEHEQRLSQCIRHQGDVCGTTDISEEDYKSMPQFIHESLASWMVENKQFSIHGVHSYRESPYENLKRVVNIFKNPFHKRDIFKPDVTETVLKSIAAMSKNSDVIVLCGDRDFYQKVAIVSINEQLIEVQKSYLLREPCAPKWAQSYQSLRQQEELIELFLSSEITGTPSILAIF